MDAHREATACNEYALQHARSSCLVLAQRDISLRTKLGTGPRLRLIAMPERQRAFLVPTRKLPLD
ncbi:MAG: hypothetical protein BGO98_08765 [Myxococcales bacterium 68-20]|nr:MAG: hypothetical protein BGO98_08765 [Myxococcales bacterium 68-20]